MTVNPLAGKPLRYVIGIDSDPGMDGMVTEIGYDATQKPAHGIGIKYCNLFDEKNSGAFAPYLDPTDTSSEYGEGVIDPNGAGWGRNLAMQFDRAKAQRFEYIELDNCDAYKVKDVIRAIEQATGYGLKVIAKNPGSMDEDALPIIAHPNVYGIIVEKDAGTVAAMDALRKRAMKPDLPVWFVAFGNGRAWAQGIAAEARAAA